jgi:hypothetical protein
LLSLAAVAGWSDERLIAHSKEVAQILPVIGFYLQPCRRGTSALLFFLAPFRRNSECRCHQDCSLQSLSDAGRAQSRRRIWPRHRAIHRQ